MRLEEERARTAQEWHAPIEERLKEAFDNIVGREGLEKLKAWDMINLDNNQLNLSGAVYKAAWG